MQTVDIGHDRGWLAPAPAASIARVDRALGHPQPINSAGRSDADQQDLIDRYNRGEPGIYQPAAVGTSPHNRGVAIDIPNPREAEPLLNEHGWWRPLPKSDPVHFLYSASRDQHIHDLDPTPIPQEDTDMIAIRQTGLPDSGIILQPGIPPYSLPEQVFLTQASSFGLTIHDLPDWRYGTAVREHWAAYSVAQNAKPSMSQTDVDRIAAATREALEQAHTP
jgi:hypothetical protein